MCTVTWLATRDGFELRMNRDERRTRSVAIPPAVYERDGVRYVAPRDVDGGGTWIAVNDAGLAVCLLNGPVAPDGQAGQRSRGLLVEELASAWSVDDVRMRFRQTSLSCYASFTMLVLEPGAPACLVRWDGATIVVDASARQSMLLTSSSVDLEAVVASRTAVHREYMRTSRGRDAEMLERFHRDHGPDCGHLSVCMHREDATTVSYTRVAVCRDAVLMHYEDGPPCAGLRFDPIALARRSAVVTPRPLAGVR